MCKYRRLERTVYGRLSGCNAVAEHVPGKYKDLQRELQISERERQDVLHMLELTEELGDDRYIELAVELQKVIRARREIKNEIEYYKALMELHKNGSRITYKIIRDTLAGVTTTLKDRVYYVRERTDLTEYIKGDIQLRTR